MFGLSSTFGFTLPDLLAFAFFVAAWSCYHYAIEYGSRSGLNVSMAEYRMRWMAEMSRRDNRIVDANIMTSLQNGTAFFASTSLLAIGASATLLRASDDAVKIAADLPFGIAATRTLWEVKVIGILFIFGYAFFKFAWAYRLFNYAAVLVGATPAAGSPDAAERALIAGRAGRMGVAAARHFTRGQRAFFLALAYLGWFLSPSALAATTAFVMVVMWSRQFASDAHDAIEWTPSDEPKDGAKADKP